MKRIRILFLVANPSTTTWSELDTKMRGVRRELQNFKNLVFDATWAAGIDDLKMELDFYQPHIVHFICHFNISSALVVTFVRIVSIFRLH